MHKREKIIFTIIIILIIIWIFYKYIWLNYINVRPIKQQLIVLHNYNPEAGLHWMSIYNTIVAHNEAKKNNLKLVVVLDSGLYLENKNNHIDTYKDYIDTNNNEWFSYYFKPIGIDDPEINSLWKQGKLNNLPSYTKYNFWKNVIGYEFDRSALEKSDKNINFSKEFEEAIELKPYLKNKIEEFYNKNMNGKFIIGIHARGTDKFSSVDSHENHPKHFTYKTYCDAIEKEILEQRKIQNKPISVLACSDEQPFINYMNENLGKKYEVITADNILRSNISTSGVNLICDDKNPDCEKYKNNSIHRGMTDQSNFKKGMDAVYEVYLLSKCDVFYKSRGNFSNSVSYINPNIRVVDMVSTLN